MLKTFFLTLSILLLNDYLVISRMVGDNSWRTATFRQGIVSKIDEEIRQSGISPTRNSMEVESYIFQNVKTKEEYLALAAMFILRVRKMGNEINDPKSAQGGPGMPDSINTLQNLANQVSRNNPMKALGGPQSISMGGPQQMPPISATNLLQTLLYENIQARPTMVMGNNGPMPNQMGNQLPDRMANQLVGQINNQMVGQLTNQFQNQLNINQLQGQVGGPLGGQVQNQFQGQLQNQLDKKYLPFR